MAKKSVSGSTFYKSSNISGPGSTEYKNPRGVMTVGDKSSLPESVNQRMMRANAAALRRAKAPAMASIDIRGYLGDERTGVRKPTTSMASRAAAAAPKKAPAVVSTTVPMRLTPVKASPGAKAKPTPASPMRMGGLGVTTGKVTGSSATRAGTGGRTSMSPSQRAAQNAFNKGGVAGPTRNAAGKSVSSASSKGAFGGGGKKR